VEERLAGEEGDHSAGGEEGREGDSELSGADAVAGEQDDARDEGEERPSMSPTASSGREARRSAARA
jgi:hypothetical protein